MDRLKKDKKRKNYAWRTINDAFSTFYPIPDFANRSVSLVYVVCVYKTSSLRSSYEKRVRKKKKKEKRKKSTYMQETSTRKKESST